SDEVVGPQDPGVGVRGGRGPWLSPAPASAGAHLALNDLTAARPGRAARAASPLPRLRPRDDARNLGFHSLPQNLLHLHAAPPALQSHVSLSLIEAAKRLLDQRQADQPF